MQRNRSRAAAPTVRLQALVPLTSRYGSVEIGGRAHGLRLGVVVEADRIYERPRGERRDLHPGAAGQSERFVLGLDVSH